MAKNILWLDNDPAFIAPYVTLLANEGYDVTVVTSLSEAENVLTTNRYDLLILDMMVPTKTDEEERVYDPGLTDAGLKSGVLFYQRMKARLDATGTAVFVLTIGLNSRAVEDFVEAGLPRAHFGSKMNLREASVLLAAIKPILLSGVSS